MSYEQAEATLRAFRRQELQPDCPRVWRLPRLVHAVLSRPVPPRSPRVQRRRTVGMRPVVVRFPGEDLSRLRVLANSRGQPLSALLRNILIAYCQAAVGECVVRQFPAGSEGGRDRT
jgi:hypothetical protein